MSQALLIDTDVMVDYLRGCIEAVAWFDNIEGPLYLSTITIAELYAGVREGRERSVLDEFMTVFNHVVIDQNIAKQGGIYRRDYSKSHGVGLADAIIAATAVIVNSNLVTRNTRLFPMVEKVVRPY